MSSSRQQKIENLIQLAVNAEKHRIEMQKLPTIASADAEIAKLRQTIKYNDEDITGSNNFKNNHPFLDWLIRGPGFRESCDYRRNNAQTKINNIEANKPVITSTLESAQAAHQKLVEKFVDQACELKGSNTEENIKKLAKEAYEYASTQRKFETELLYKLNKVTSIPTSTIISNTFSIGVNSRLLDRNKTDSVAPTSFALIMGAALYIGLAYTLATSVVLALLVPGVALLAAGLIGIAIASYSAYKANKREQSFAEAIQPNKVVSIHQLSTTAKLGFVAAPQITTIDSATVAANTSTSQASAAPSTATDTLSQQPDSRRLN